MHADSEPPGQSSGVGDGEGAGVGGAEVVVRVAQSSAQTPTQTSYADPVSTAQAALHAAMEPPGHGFGDGLGGEGLGGGLGGEGLGVGTGAGQLVSTALAASCFT